MTSTSPVKQRFDYVPEDIGTLAEIARNLKPPAVFTVTDPNNNYTIRQGNIHLVTVTDQDSATHASIALALELQKQTTVTLLSFAGNTYTVPARMLDALSSDELPAILVHRLEKFSFYEEGRDLHLTIICASSGRELLSST